MLYTLMVLGGLLVIILSVVEGNDWVQILSELIAILGVELLVVELHQARQIMQSEHLSKLNSSFVTNDDYKAVYELLEAYDFENMPDIEINDRCIASYISFFEVFQILRENGTLSIEMINDLFGHRFFIAVHNPYVQKHFLLNESKNYKKIFILEHDWMKYRQEHDYKIFNEEYQLSNIVGSDVYKNLVSHDE